MLLERRGRRRHELRCQIATDVCLPDRATVDAMDRERGVHRGQVRVHVLEVAEEEVLGARVVRGRDDLRKIDDRRALGGEQDVVRRQIAVHEIVAEQCDQLDDDIGVDAHHRIGLERDLFEPWRGPPLVIEHERHEQHALVKHHRCRGAYARIDELEQRIRFGRFPRLFGRIAAELAAAVHRALGPRIANLAAFFVLDVVLEAARLAVLVDLRREHGIAAADHRDGRFFAALDPAEDLVDHAIGQQRIE